MRRALAIIAVAVSALGAAEVAEAKDVTVRKGHTYQVPRGYELRAIRAGGHKLIRACPATNLVCRYWPPRWSGSYTPIAITTFRRGDFQPRVEAVTRDVRVVTRRWGPLH